MWHVTRVSIYVTFHKRDRHIWASLSLYQCVVTCHKSLYVCDMSQEIHMRRVTRVFICVTCHKRYIYIVMSTYLWDKRAKRALWKTYLWDNRAKRALCKRALWKRIYSAKDMSQEIYVWHVTRERLLCVCLSCHERDICRHVYVYMRHITRETYETCHKREALVCLSLLSNVS